MNPYIKVICKVDNTLREALVAFLSRLPFDAFEEEDNKVFAYLPASAWSQFIESEIKSLQSKLPFSFQVEHLPGKNWNTYWESQFDPVIIPGFCTIRAPFHQINTETPFEIIMQPKMSFGTGHHETTRLMMECMQKLDFNGKQVLDFGAGTGILAMLAAKLGADPVFAVEIDRDSFLNLEENVKRNEVKVNTKFGGVEVLGENDYDVLLVNITRNTIVKVLPVLASLTKPGGTLICSGFLREDGPKIIERAEQLGYGQEEMYGNNWAAMSFLKK